MTPGGVQCYNIHHESIILDIFTNGDFYDNDSYTSSVDWTIEKTPKIDLKKVRVQNQQTWNRSEEDRVQHQRQQ